MECGAWYNEPMARATLLLVILAFAGVCGSPRIARGETPAPLVLLVATDRPSYAQGDTATVTIAIDNPTALAVPVAFHSAQRFDLAVRAGDVEVWRWSADRDFAQVDSEQAIAPGVTLLGRVTWDWRDATGAPLHPGPIGSSAR